jgi:hypothetical protein
MRRYPKHIGATAREWRRRKRREWRAIQRAFETFSIGSAYTPTFRTEFQEIESALMRGAVKLSPKEWGR